MVTGRGPPVPSPELPALHLCPRSRTLTDSGHHTFSFRVATTWALSRSPACLSSSLGTFCLCPLSVPCSGCILFFGSSWGAYWIFPPLSTVLSSSLEEGEFPHTSQGLVIDEVLSGVQQNEKNKEGCYMWEYIACCLRVSCMWALKTVKCRVMCIALFLKPQRLPADPWDVRPFATTGLPPFRSTINLRPCHICL